MKVFCPNCGVENNGMPGGRITCGACTSSFEVPRESGWVAPPPTVAPKPVVTPVAQVGYQGPPPTGFMRGPQSVPLNQLAIVSIVLGIVCCIPFSGIGAVITGFIARQQIANSNGTQRGSEIAMIGIVLGFAAISVSVIAIILSALNPH